jgi:hypothetical protein
LAHRRPSPRKIWIELESLKKHREASRDPEFWEKIRFSSHNAQPPLLS